MESILWSLGHKLVLEDIIKAENCYIYDSTGKKYIDLESGVWCTSVGHNNPGINKLIHSQLDKIMHTGFCYANPVIEETARKILEICGLGGGKCEFLCSGSEAVEYGMRVARTIGGSPLALTFSDSYFGAYGDAARRNPDDWFIYDWLNCSCDSADACTGDCEEFGRIPFDRIGVFLFEPGSSSGLVRFPPRELITKIVEAVRSNGGIVIINEITTGIGRTGKWFGYQHYGFEPDIVAMGKGLGNGYPVSVTAISERMAGLLEDRKFLYAQSHQNDPLGAAIAGKVIETIENEGLVERSRSLGKKIIDHLNDLSGSHSLIREARGRGLMIAIDFRANAEAVHKELLRTGFIITKRSGVEVLRMDPALTVEKADIELFLEALGQLIEELQLLD